MKKCGAIKDACVIEGNIQPAKSRQTRINNFRYVFLVSEVGGDEVAIMSGISEIREDRFASGFVTSSEYDGGSLSTQGRRYYFSYSLGATSN